MWSSWKDEELEKDGRPKVVFIGVFWDKNSELFKDSLDKNSGIKQILERTQKIYVDAEEEPYLALRYAIGDVPTLAFLSPDGRLVGGGNLADSKTVFKFLVEMMALWNTERERILKYVAEDRKENIISPEVPSDIDSKLVDIAKRYKDVSSKIVKDTFSSENGFPDRWDSVKFTNILWAVEHMHDFSPTVLNYYISQSDKIEGGFFKGGMRGRRTAKICSENLLFAYFLWKKDKKHYKDEIEKILKFVITNFWSDSDGFFSSMKDDEGYYASTKDIRQISERPKTDMRIFSLTNAISLFVISELVEDFGFLEPIAKRNLNFLLNMVDENGNVSVVRGKREKIFLKNQVFVSLALRKYLDRFGDKSEVSNIIAKIISASKKLDTGAFFSDTVPEGFGYMKNPYFDPISNVLLSYVFWNEGRKKEAVDLMFKVFLKITSKPDVLAYSIPLWTHVMLKMAKEFD